MAAVGSSEGRGTGPGPLAGVKVIEMGQLLAGPFCGQLLADYGADVIKIEPPGVGDPLRVWGRELVDGEGYWWPIAGRGKRSVTVNLREEEGQQLVRELVAEADIVLENFRPGTMERWNLGYEQLASINPAVIMVRVSGYGQTGPYATRPGYAAVGEALGGLRYVMGDPERPPSRAGISIGDSLAAMFATLGALAALHQARISGKGQVVDSSIYESVLAVMESIIPEYVFEGFIRERTGPFLPNIAPSNIFQSKDGDWVIIAANQDSLFKRLTIAMEQPELATDPRYVDHVSRGHNQVELDERIAVWARTKSTDDLLAVLEANSVVCGPIYRVPEMLEDPQFAARQSIVRIPHPVLGDFPMQNIAPRFSGTPAEIRWVGPKLGQHTEQVLGEQLGYAAERIADLHQRGIV
jgi:crotonobetainyl-CoA:carnitine CoA-transferase CaiB-like acyl-CoA transferase